MKTPEKKQVSLLEELKLSKAEVEEIRREIKIDVALKRHRIEFLKKQEKNNSPLIEHYQEIINDNLEILKMFD